MIRHNRFISMESFIKVQELLSLILSMNMVMSIFRGLLYLIETRLIKSI